MQLPEKDANVSDPSGMGCTARLLLLSVLKMQWVDQADAGDTETKDSDLRCWTWKMDTDPAIFSDTLDDSLGLAVVGGCEVA